jgi:hypothetical protein
MTNAEALLLLANKPDNMPGDQEAKLARAVLALRGLSSEHVALLMHDVRQWLSSRIDAQSVDQSSSF